MSFLSRCGSEQPSKDSSPRHGTDPADTEWSRHELSLLNPLLLAGPQAEYMLVLLKPRGWVWFLTWQWVNRADITPLPAISTAAKLSLLYSAPSPNRTLMLRSHFSIKLSSLCDSSVLEAPLYSVCLLLMLSSLYSLKNILFDSYKIIYLMYA